ncbi:M20/M25/M40 family metallo-hydrolase [bacterium]|nr:MAG: M20/M25/M40 family metallo-hydrolase [bacterium]
MIDEQRLLKRFRDLVLIDSPAQKEAVCVAHVKKELEDMGLEVHEDNASAKIGGNANNLVAWKRGTLKDAPKIFLSAHMDTVEPTPNLQLVKEDGVIRTDGTTILGADCKGGLAPAIEAIQCLLDSGEDHGDVCLLFSIQEEIGLRGADAMEIEDLNLDYGFVLDTGPPVGTYVTRTATHDKLDIKIHGRPAHAGKDPENGLNALQVAADAIHGMKLGRIGPETTANIGSIEGGTATNVVMAEVRLKAEARSTNVEELDAQVAHMIDRFEAAAAAWGTVVEIDHKRHYSSYHVSEDTPVVQVAQAASRALGFEPNLRTTLGGSDANIFNAKGLPSIVVATGMDKIHTHEEFIKVQDLVDTARLALELIRQAAKQKR